MKFKHKVYDHKRKVGIDFESFGPNSLGIRGQKGPQLNFVWFHKKMNYWGSLSDMLNLNMYLDFLLWAQLSRWSKIKLCLISTKSEYMGFFGIIWI